MKYIKLQNLNTPVELDPPTYPGERLSDVIVRAMEQGVSPEMGINPLVYDEDESFEVDPNSDIRTDLFGLAEKAEAGFTASQLQKLKNAEVSASSTEDEQVSEETGKTEPQGSSNE